ncbi:thiamine diphosphokinase [Staphylococcus intermedius]|uniref:Thiamine diphosphokinase n=1 Tax=Staphylococcus intermedius NCTC 11048 TaxID=1141106 RepID=A0A380G740_STAIN|nr:thiamine diphosphokinase [Staphylococcus intermedius]PCF65110.1 thiamine pyrophosphokinase [Staphylococcus intermedius]PCF80721.1 thiamine pyrophosphokinase [Staphylococcus intermedius]PCF82070.1 thiamine pyrophosphokinase [Staphylococcus intermedius]PCF88406.1 thiamine pyrophosphokinase [Staphylococcus intermedius]PCF89121.1 thiamine pyrophosphokinase [Staphylococcus intermedius]
MTDQTVCLLCSDRELPAALFDTRRHQTWGGVDRGTMVLLQHNITPIFAVGDFDSISESEREWLQTQLDINPVPAEKADTDLALAVRTAVEQGYRHIQIFGATGGRLDHFMGAMQLLQHPDFETVRIQLIDRQNEIEYLTEGQHVLQNDPTYRYVSFMQGTDEVVLSLKGFKYALCEQQLNRGETLTVSNEFDAEQGEVIIHQGGVYFMRSRDM